LCFWPCLPNPVSAVKGQEDVPVGESFEYKKTRDFSYKTTEAKESFVFFIRSGDGVYYNQIADQIRLAKRRDKKVGRVLLLHELLATIHVRRVSRAQLAQPWMCSIVISMRTSCQHRTTG
jgi:hypothetical protein